MGKLLLCDPFVIPAEGLSLGVRGKDVGKLLLCDPFVIPAEGLSLGVDGGGG